jgi:hypothetical protein
VNSAAPVRRCLRVLEAGARWFGGRANAFSLEKGTVMLGWDSIETPTSGVRVLVYIGVLGVVGVLGDLAVAWWAKTGGPKWFAVGAVLWVTSLWMLGLLLRSPERSLSHLTVLITVIHVLLVVVVENAYLARWPARHEWLGIILGLLAVLLLETHQGEDVPPSTNSAAVQQLDNSPDSPR